jgi:hypothetical protein
VQVALVNVLLHCCWAASCMHVRKSTAQRVGTQSPEPFPGSSCVPMAIFMGTRGLCIA